MDDEKDKVPITTFDFTILHGDYVVIATNLVVKTARLRRKHHMNGPSNTYHGAGDDCVPHHRPHDRQKCSTYPSLKAGG
jgi:hypothetical protein